jgi:hypothetical protein
MVGRRGADVKGMHKAAASGAYDVPSVDKPAVQAAGRLRGMRAYGQESGSDKRQSQSIGSERPRRPPASEMKQHADFRRDVGGLLAQAEAAVELEESVRTEGPLDLADERHFFALALQQGDEAPAWRRLLDLMYSSAYSPSSRRESSPS